MSGLDGTTAPPSRDCPICQEKIWPRIDLKSPGSRWRSYDLHIRVSHHNYWIWNRRTSFYYLVPLFLFLGSIPAAALLVQYDQAAPLVPSLVILFSWLTALFLGVSILSVKEKGKQRFRILWLAEHRYPVS